MSLSKKLSPSVITNTIKKGREQNTIQLNIQHKTRKQNEIKNFYECFLPAHGHSR